MTSHQHPKRNWVKMHFSYIPPPWGQKNQSVYKLSEMLSIIMKKTKFLWRGRLSVERCQLCLQDTSRIAKWHQRAAVGHWVSLCVWSVVEWLIVYQDGNYLILANTVDCRSYDTAFGAGTFSWQDPVHSWKTGKKSIFCVFRLFSSLCRTASRPYRLSLINVLRINQSY